MYVSARWACRGVIQSRLFVLSVALFQLAPRSNDLLHRGLHGGMVYGAFVDSQDLTRLHKAQCLQQGDRRRTSQDFEPHFFIVQFQLPEFRVLRFRGVAQVLGHYLEEFQLSS